MPEDERRYEIIDGDLFVSRQPHWHHQATCGRIFALLDAWSLASGLGEASLAPGVILADDDDVAPDVVWAGADRLATLDESGKLRGVPELVVEVLSPGIVNERRDREAKLKLYARWGVEEYWIADWRARTVDVYRRDGPLLDPVARLSVGDTLESPLLPGFSAPLARLFPGVERQ